jgi:hypothetical protein
MKIRNIDWKSIVHEEIELDEYAIDGKPVVKHSFHKQHPADELEGSHRKHVKRKRPGKPYRLDKRSMIEIDNH